MGFCSPQWHSWLGRENWCPFAWRADQPRTNTQDTENHLRKSCRRTYRRDTDDVLDPQPASLTAAIRCQRLLGLRQLEFTIDWTKTRIQEQKPTIVGILIEADSLTEGRAANQRPPKRSSNPPSISQWFVRAFACRSHNRFLLDHATKTRSKRKRATLTWRASINGWDKVLSENDAKDLLQSYAKDATTASPLIPHFLGKEEGV